MAVRVVQSALFGAKKKKHMSHIASVGELRSGETHTHHYRHKTDKFSRVAVSSQALLAAVLKSALKGLVVQLIKKNQSHGVLTLHH